MKKNIFKILLIISFIMPVISVSAASKVSCGNVTGIPAKIPELTSFGMTIIQVAVPVILVVLGTIDLLKGITSSKEEEIKKGQQTFIKRLILAAIIFFVVVIFKFLISAVADSSKADIVECIDCFVSNNCKESNIETNIGKFIDKAKDEVDSKKKETSDSEESSGLISTIITATKDKDSSSSDKKNSSSSSSSSNTSKKIKNNLYVGDSRTVGMCDGYKLCEKHPYIAKGSMGYTWFEDTAIPQINQKIKSKNYNIIILMGVNGAGKDGTSEADKYYSKIASLAKGTWKKQNVIFVSVNPVVDGKSYTYMSGVNSFNKRMKSKINSSKISNLKYCDTISSLKMSEIDSGDGLHYNKKGYQKIYNLIKTKCL